MWKKERKKLCCGSTALAWWEALRRGGTPAPSMWFIALTSVTICFLFLFLYFLSFSLSRKSIWWYFTFCRHESLFCKLVSRINLFCKFWQRKTCLQIAVSKNCLCKHCQNYQQLGQRHPSWFGIYPKNTFLLEGVSLSPWFLTKQSEHWY